MKMLGQSNPVEPYCLDSRYSTTRLVVGHPSTVNQEPDCKIQFLHQLHEDAGRQGMGGLRTKGIYKCSLSDKPLISVITVVFNCVSTVEATIQSVLSQTYDNVEFIVIDGGSTDGTQEVIRKYEGSIDYWVSEKDAGIYDAMNKGIALAKGEYIGMLNADDYFSSTSSLELIATRLKTSDVDAVFSCLDIVDPTNPARVLRKYRVSRYSPFMLRIGVMPPHPTFYCKRSCYEMAGLYRTDYRIAADFEMLVRLLIKQHISWEFINVTTIKMRSGGLSNSGINANWVVNREIIRACTENGLYTNTFMLTLKLPLRLLELIL